MTQNKIWLSSPHMGGTEQKYIQEAFDANFFKISFFFNICTLNYHENLNHYFKYM